jgi:Transcriptional regulator
MNRDLIQTFLAITKTHNISKAAEMLHRSQSAVSQRLQQLEEDLGTSLISRQKGHKNVELTVQGEEFVSIAERWLLLDEEAQMVKHKLLRTRLSVSGVDSLNHYFFAPFFADFCMREPAIELQVWSNHTYDIYDLMEDQSIDLGIVNHDAFRLNTVSELLFHEPFTVVGGIWPGHGEGKERIHPTSLDMAKGIYQTYGPEFHQWRHYWFETGQTLLKVNSIAILAPLLRNLGCWCIVPLSVAQVLADKNSCGWRYLEEAPPMRTCYLVRHKHGRPYNTEAVNRFVSVLKEYVAVNISSQTRALA